jgi:hypothetical protein
MNVSGPLTFKDISRVGFLALAFACALLTSPSAQAQGCGAPAADVVSTVNLPGAPFSAIPTKDGCTIFVSLMVQQDRATTGHIAVFSRAGGKVTLAHDLSVPGQGFFGGMALSHDGKSLAVSNNSGILLLDTNRLALLWQIFG